MSAAKVPPGAITDGRIESYLRFLINLFFKILPMWENEEDSLLDYMLGLQAKLFGFGSVVPELGDNPLYLSMSCILQNMIEHPELGKARVKHDVFECISVCNKLIGQLGEEVDA